MYMPPKFAMDDLSELQRFMQAHQFATLITQGDELPHVSHLPLLIDTDKGPYGMIEGHFARMNSHWQEFEQGKEILIIFQGPHTYVSASWYEKTARAVPTWSYTVVHAYGRAKIIEDEQRLYDLLVRQIDNSEQYQPQPWHLEMSFEEARAQIRGIVGFEIEITRLEGKYKISQNRSQTDQARVYQHLSQGEDQQGQEVARMMERFVLSSEGL